VAVPLDVRVTVDGKEHILRVREISRSGIFLYTADPVGKLGVVLQLRLSIVAGIRPLTVDAQVVRIARDASGNELGLALRFLHLDAVQEKAILELIDRAMNGRGTGPRAFPRISFQQDVNSSSGDKPVLRDIGEGGAGLQLKRRVDVGSELHLDLDLGAHGPLQVGTVVTSCQEEAGGLFRVGVRFHRLSAEAREKLGHFLRELYHR
jgi:hypothetical protein